MSNFKDTMMTELEAFKNATAPAEPNTPAARKKTSIEYVCDVSGIDMTVSRMTNGKCSKMLFIYLSQLDSSGKGTMFIKTVKDGTMVNASSDNLMVFFRDLQGEKLQTGSNAIPSITSGRDFADSLMMIRDTELIDLIKEGLFNTELLDDGHAVPWYAKKNYDYRSFFGVGIEDRHGKLIRHMVEAISKKYNISYSEALADTCAKWGRDFSYVWAFSALADVFDEPFATRCFDEYLDNERLSGL